MTRILATALLGSALIAGAAQAEDAFVLGDAQLDNVTAAGTVVFNTDVDKTVDISKFVTVFVDKQVFTDVSLTGSLATAEASADAIDFTNVLAETEVFTQVDSTGAFSFADSLSAGIN
ncbi:MAG: hypothetical protein AAFP17_10825 [Pseudomonadota bacterium]